jgi:two-component sensor histidine kinase
MPARQAVQLSGACMTGRFAFLTEPFRRLPAASRFTGISALALAAIYAATHLPDGLSTGHLQFLLLVMVLLSAWLSGLAAGLIGATLGFGFMLWRAVAQEAGNWTLDFQAVFDAFLWFALAKLAAALIAGPRYRLRRLAEAQRRAEAEARQKDMLLDEMSHRVTNDLQRLVALLHSQAANDPGAAEALRVAASRVQVLRSVHERLSQRDAAAIVDSRVFIEGLVEELRAAVDGIRPIALTVRSEAHPLPVVTAGDVGLVVNELVTNALKHAFPTDREGLIRVTFHRDDAAYELVVADNGVGPAGDAWAARAEAGGMGTRLLRALAAQLGGRLDVMGGEVGGTSCRLRFPVALHHPLPGALPLAAEQPQDPGDVSAQTAKRSSA